MRLLRIEDDDDFSLVEHVGSNIPPYAILSHTWGADESEATFKDLVDGTGKTKTGYDKIRFCAQQAVKDNLCYFWVDTCCIDKSSSAELAEAINSMFRWYKNADRCYVYLSDVSVNSLVENDQSFQKSRWFTRGWTLQELVAPTSVEFFSVEGERLGDKCALVQEITKITGISAQACQGRSLFEFSINERMSWVAGRETKREEDGAYSLLGIFDVYMPLIYGEGREKAFTRLLKEINESNGGSRRKSSTLQQDARCDKMRQWLSAPDPSTNYQKALKQRQAYTGLWFLQGEQYARWRTDVASYLWLHGIPGCGKTILSSTILQSVLQHCNDNYGTVAAYFYFDFNDKQKQDPDLMLRSLISQLLRQPVQFPTGLSTLYSSCESGTHPPSSDALLEAIKCLIDKFPNVYIILDALDECTQRVELMDVLEIMAGWQLQELHLLVTSRKERDIESSLESFIDQQDIISIQSQVVDKDIQKYVGQRLSDDKSLSKWQKDPAVRQEIEDSLMAGAHGMFRWAVCQLDALGKCRNRLMLRKSLASLPPTLDKTYDRILSNIHEEDSEYAIRILRWLAFSLRPLLLEEISEIVAIDVERHPAFDRQEVLEDPLEALDICSSLVTISITEPEDHSYQYEGNDRLLRQFVSLAHYSVKEYLTSERIRQGQVAKYSMHEDDCNQLIARSCLGYLLQFQQSEPLSAEIFEESKLVDYSARNWIRHARIAEKQTEELSQLALKLLSIENPAYLNWLWIFNPDDSWRQVRQPKELMAVPLPLYYAALCGLTDVTTRLLESGVDVNAQGGRYGNALQAASDIGHMHIVQLLFNKGVNINAQSGYYGNALQAALVRSHKKIVKLLLDKGANVNAQDGEYGNVLQTASAHGHEQIVKLLLDKGADINAQGGEYGNALQGASYRNQEHIVTLLLDQGVNVDYLDNRYGPLKHLLALKGNIGLLQLVLEHYHADQNLVDFHNRTTLQLAARGGNIDTLQYLIDLGLDHLPEDAMSNSLLHHASSGGSLQVVNAVLDLGPMPLSRSRHWTPLHWACRAGNVSVVERLIKQGSRGEFVTLPQSDVPWSPTDIAIFHGEKEMLEELSVSCRSMLDAEGDSSVAVAANTGWSMCMMCFHVIYGTIFQCGTCKKLNYCFMCQPFLDHLHKDHTWHRIEYYDDSTSE